MSAPRLVAVAHGTRHAPGNAVAVALTRAAGAALGLPARAAYVELCAPLLPAVLAASSAPTVVVPLLLTTGHHVRHDLPEALGAAPGPAVLARPLGPDPLLARAQVDRLRARGARPGQPVVMVAAGSRDPLAGPELARAAALLEAAWGGPVTLATLSGRGRRPAEVVTPAHAVSPYLLAEGFFAARTRSESRVAACVADVLGAHPAVVALVGQRFGEVAGEVRPESILSGA